MSRITLKDIIDEVGEKGLIDLLRETCYLNKIVSFKSFMYDLKFKFLEYLNPVSSNSFEDWKGKHCPAPCETVEEGGDCRDCFLLDEYIKRLLPPKGNDSFTRVHPGSISSEVTGLVFPKRKKNPPINEEVRF